MYVAVSLRVQRPVFLCQIATKSAVSAQISFQSLQYIILRKFAQWGQADTRGQKDRRMDVTKLIGAFRDLANAHSSGSMRQWQVGSVSGNKPADSPSSGHPGALCEMSLMLRSCGESDGESHGVSR